MKIIWCFFLAHHIPCVCLKGPSSESFCPRPWGVFLPSGLDLSAPASANGAQAESGEELLRGMWATQKKGPMVVCGGNFSIGKVTFQVSPLGLTQYNLVKFLRPHTTDLPQKVAKEGKSPKKFVLELERFEGSFPAASISIATATATRSGSGRRT